MVITTQIFRLGVMNCTPISQLQLNIRLLEQHPLVTTVRPPDLFQVVIIYIFKIASVLHDMAVPLKILIM